MMEYADETRLDSLRVKEGTIMGPMLVKYTGAVVLAQETLV